MKRIIGVNSNCYHGYSIEDAIDGIRAAGFRYIELTATKGWTEHVFPDKSFHDLLQIKDRIMQAGLIPFALSGHCNLMDRERLSDFIANIHLAAFYGCDYIVSSIGEAHLKDEVTLSNLDAAQNIKMLLPYLKEHHIKLALETHGEHGTGAIIKEIVELVDSELVSINYDTANVIYYGGVDLEKDLNLCIDRVGYVHLKDKKGETKEWNFPALGEGIIDFPKLLGMFDSYSNDCPFSIEIEFTQSGPKSLDEINQAVKVSYEYLKAHGFDL